MLAVIVVFTSSRSSTYHIPYDISSTPSVCPDSLSYRDTTLVTAVVYRKLFSYVRQVQYVQQRRVRLFIYSLGAISRLLILSVYVELP